jgi:hypothetical protein
MHAKNDLRLFRFFDGINNCLAMLEVNHGDLTRIVGALSPKDAPGILRAMSLAWTLVDIVHRSRELAQALPGLGKKEPAVREFLAATQLAEDFRHYIQHLRSELAKPSIGPFPVWGSFSWVDSEGMCHTACQGTLLPNTSFSSCVFDREEGRWVSKVALSIHSVSFNIDPICESTVRFCRYAQEWIRQAKGDGLKIIAQPLVVTMTLKFPAAPDDAASPVAEASKR